MAEIGGKLYCNLNEFEPEAKGQLETSAFGYLSSGSESEWTLRENQRAFQDYAFVPRCLVDVSAASTCADILSYVAPSPIIIPPMAMQRLCHPSGEVGMALASKHSGMPYILSTMSTSSMDEVISTGHPCLMFQLYCLTDRNITKSMIQAAEAKGFKAIIVTVDAPRLGKREMDERHHFSLPEHLQLKIIEEHGAQPGQKNHARQLHSNFGKKFSSMIDDALTWESIDWIKSLTSLPVFVKGILAPQDAVLAMKHSVDGIIISNHGGRQLDYAVPSVHCIKDIKDVVKSHGSSIPVWVDGGIRRGTDIVKCLALGADAVLVGRPFLWALALGGPDGAEKAMKLLQTDLERAMCLLGCQNIKSISLEHVRKRQGWS